MKSLTQFFGCFQMRLHSSPGRLLTSQGVDEKFLTVFCAPFSGKAQGSTWKADKLNGAAL
jgi:hypothetical protein